MRLRAPTRRICSSSLGHGSALTVLLPSNLACCLKDTLAIGARAHILSLASRRSRLENCHKNIEDSETEDSRAASVRPFVESLQNHRRKGELEMRRDICAQHASQVQQ